MAPASTTRQIGGKGRVQRGTDSAREILEALRAKLSLYSSEKGPTLAEKIEERSEEWPGAESLQVSGVTNVWSVVLYSAIQESGGVDHKTNNVPSRCTNSR